MTAAAELTISHVRPPGALGKADVTLLSSVRTYFLGISPSSFPMYVSKSKVYVARMSHLQYVEDDYRGNQEECRYFHAATIVALSYHWRGTSSIYTIQPSLVAAHRHVRLLQVLVLLQPRLDVLRVSLQPCGFGADGINALRQRHVKALGALALEERLDVFHVFPVREA
jgi:hypothetical protein